MPQIEPKRPILWIVAGANGSGKSTCFQNVLVKDASGAVWIINPDLLTLRIMTQEGLFRNEANLEAVKRIERWLHASIATHQTVGVETVLSTGKYRKLVRAAKRKGFLIHLVYVSLRSADLNIRRVRQRVRQGGHDVPAEKIRSRRLRSFAELPWFLYHADSAQLFDNSGDAPELVAEKIDQVVYPYGKLIPELQQAIELTVSGQIGR
ncbi:MAG TPA: AAA family ATPase [Alphaproteobacteria bacterium]|nr:AAA family ATPase [Alphaproteobacteria bacterium]